MLKRPKVLQDDINLVVSWETPSHVQGQYTWYSMFRRSYFCHWKEKYLVVILQVM